MSNGQHRSAVPRSAACVRVASSVGEEALHQLVAINLEVSGHITENRRECAVPSFNESWVGTVT